MDVDVRERRRLVTRVALAVVAGLVVCGVAAGWRWHTHPTVFPEALGVTWSGPLREDREFMMVGITVAEPGDDFETVTLHSAVPVVRKNTVGATYELYVCTGGGGSQLGFVSGSLDRYCPDAVRVREGTTLRTGGTPPQQLVMLVRMSGDGVSVTDGVRLSYAHGLQDGVQVVGPRVRVRPGPAPSSRG